MTGDEVVIEQRDEAEVRCMPYGHQWLPIAPSECDVFNPAFDITPNELITGVITETGIEFAGRVRRAWHTVSNDSQNQ